MKITIDTDNFDLTALETLIVRTIVRTVKTLARDNLLPWALAQPTAVEITPEAPTKPTNGHAVEAAPEPTPEPTPPVFNRHYNTPAVEPPPKPKKHRERHPLLEVVKTVATKPNGYIDMKAAAELIGGTDNVKVQLYTWIKSRQINAVIVANVAPPSKGMPGRLMVSRSEVLERDALRRHNATAAYSDRMTAPKLAEQPQSN